MPFKPDHTEASAALDLLRRKPALALAVDAHRYQMFNGAVGHAVKAAIPDWHEIHPSRRPSALADYIKQQHNLLCEADQRRFTAQYFLDVVSRKHLQAVVDLDAYVLAVALYSADARVLQRESDANEKLFRQFAHASARNITAVMCDAECHLHAALQNKRLPSDDVKNFIKALAHTEWYYDPSSYCADLSILRVRPSRKEST